MIATDRPSADSPDPDSASAVSGPAVAPSEVAPLLAATAADLGGRYAVLRCLGRGASATVWLARDGVTGEFVAVKRFDGRRGDGRGFYREMRALFRLSHPRIVRIVNLRESSAARYLILEYCAGGSLRSPLRRAASRRQAVPLSWAASLARQVAEGLDEAHRLGLVHRDLKPENVLFAQPGADLSPTPPPVKLADFGLVRALQRADSAGDGAPLAGLSGSPSYMAPEQFTGSFCAASDLYALGVILYEVLHARRPFEGTPESLAFQHLRAEPAIDPRLPEPWRALLSALLTKDSQARPTSRAVLALLSALPSAPPAAAPRPVSVTHRLASPAAGVLVVDAGPTVVVVSEAGLSRYPSGGVAPQVIPLLGITQAVAGTDGDVWAARGDRILRVTAGGDVEEVCSAGQAVTALAAPAPGRDVSVGVIAGGEFREYRAGESRARYSVPLRCHGLRPPLLRLPCGRVVTAEGPISPRLLLIGPGPGMRRTIPLPGLCWQLGRWPGGDDLFAMVLLNNSFHAFRIDPARGQVLALADVPGLLFLGASAAGGPLYGWTAGGELVAWKESGAVADRVRPGGEGGAFSGFATDGRVFAVTARTDADWCLRVWTR